MVDEKGDKDSKDKTTKKKEPFKFSFKKVEEPEKKNMHRVTYIPFSFYWLKDLIREFISHKHFPDASATAIALASVSIAFPFFPLIVLIPLIILTFALSRIHPLLGLAA